MNHEESLRKHSCSNSTKRIYLWISLIFGYSRFGVLSAGMCDDARQGKGWKQEIYMRDGNMYYRNKNMNLGSEYDRIKIADWLDG